MPTFSNGPGVYVSETLNSSFATNIPTGPIAVFFGETGRGPDAPTLISDWTSYKRSFGELEDQYDIGYAMYHFFSNGGRNAYVVRTTSATSTAASVGLPYYPTGISGASASLMTVSAISKGTWGNSISVSIESGLVTDTTFTFIVKYNGVEVERWPELALSSSANRYVAAYINTYSNYIRVSNLATADTTGYFVNPNTSLGSGSNGASLTNSDWLAAFDKVDTVNGDLLLNAVGLTPTNGSPILQLLANKAYSRGDSMVIIDPDKGLTSVAEIQDGLTTLLSSISDQNRGYVAHYAPCLRMVDPAKTGPGAIRETYPGGAIAGIMSRFQLRRTVAAAPAGYTADVSGALGLVFPLSAANVGTLYESNAAPVNTFKAVPGAGVVVFGARTLALTKPDKFIPVRRTLNHLKHQLKERTQFAVFEPNDENLWVRIQATLSGYLTDFYQRGGLKGANPSEAYYIICDSTNNSPSSIDSGYVNIEVGISLLYPAEYIQINISQWTGGSNAADSL